MVGVKVRKKLQFDISMTEPQSNLHHAYKKKHVIIIHREISSTDNYNDILNIFKIKIYGRSKIIFAGFK